MKFFLLLALFGTPLIAADDILWERELTVNPGVSVYLETYKGLVRVETGKAGVMSISARVYMPDDADIEGEKAKRVLEGMQISLSDTPDNVRLVTRFDESVKKKLDGWFWKNITHPAVDLVVTLPEDANLEVETYKAAIEIQAPRGDFELETYKGRGYVRGVRGDFKLDTYKGDLEITIDEMRDVETLFSDSTVVRLMIKAPLQQIFESGDEHYPEGMYLEIYDEQQQLVATYRSNTAKKVAYGLKNGSKIKVKFV